MTDVQWDTLRPILQDLADRIARIEQHLAASGLQASGPASYGHGIEAFDAAPASFGPQASASFGSAQPYSDPAASPMSPSPMSPMPAPMGSGVPGEIAMLARSGKMIEAIKQYREMTGVGLKEAKAAVESALRGY